MSSPATPSEAARRSPVSEGGPNGSAHQRDAGRFVKRRRRAAARRDRTSLLARIRWRPRLGLVGVGAIAILLIAALAFGVIEAPDAAGPVSDAADSLGDWTYAAIPTLAFLETGAFVGLLVPGETAIVVGGVVAERGEVELPLLIALVWAAAVAGDAVSFLLGRRFGRPFLDTHGPRLRIRREHVDRVERLFDRHGAKVVLVGRFIGLLRALTPFVAGASRFPLRKFLPYTAIGALGWATAFTLVGYGFSESFQSAGRDATRIALVGALVVGTILLARTIQTRPRSRGGN
jgi:membrane-associated protein